MIEIYLFINPLGKYCFQAEKKIRKFVNEEDKKIIFRFVPYLNLHVVDQIFKNTNVTTDKLKGRNTLFNEIYSAALDYKTLQLQGNRKGQAYLFALQEAVLLSDKEYCDQLVGDILTEIKADKDMFYEDRYSDLVKKSFAADQQIAAEMGISQCPSAVVFNYTRNNDFGVLVEDCSSVEVLQDLCSTTEDGLCSSQKGKHNSQFNTKLHLL